MPFKIFDFNGKIAPPSEPVNRYILVDYSTRYPEAVPLKKFTTEAVEEALLYIYSRVGIPEEVLINQGLSLCPNACGSIQNTQQNGVSASTAYHPICNGLVE